MLYAFGLAPRRAALPAAVLLVALLFVAVPAALAQTTTVHAWGNNANGQVTVPAGLMDAVQVGTGTFHTLAVRSDGTVVAWGYNGYGQTTVPAGLSGVVHADGGNHHSVALKADGTVAAWGRPYEGQTTVPVSLTDVVQIAAGGSHTLALKADGTVVAWGSNSNGQSTLPVALSSVVQVDAGEAHSVALKADGTVVAWGLNNYGQTTVPAGLSDVVQVAAGIYHTVALKSDGTVVAWGLNNYGQLNIPAGLMGVVQVAAGVFHTVALKADGTVIAWGHNGNGETDVPAGLSGVAQIAASGSYHTLALSTDAPPVTAGPVDALGNPASEPVLVSPQGQTEVFYGGSIWNNSPDPLTLDGWPVITLPDASTIVRRRPTDFELGGGDAQGYAGAFNMLASFEPGWYTFAYHFGTHPDGTESMDAFELFKDGGILKTTGAGEQTERDGRMAARAVAELARLGDGEWVAVAPGEDVAEAFAATESSTPDLPRRTVLGAAYPNPFNPTATVPFELAEAGAVRLTVYDVLGREVARLVDGHAEAGSHTAVFDASALPSGAYLVRFEAAGQAHTQRLTLLK